MSEIKFTIKSLDGSSTTLNFPSDTKIIDVKNSLGKDKGVAADRIRLIFCGKQLDNDKTVTDYKVVNDSILHMVKLNK